MSPFSQPKVSSRVAQTSRSVSAQRITVYDFFHAHVQLLAGLPGEQSHFDQSDVGYEWRCECRISTDFPAARVDSANTLYLHFSLIDLEWQSRPVAALYLVEDWQARGYQERVLLPLEDLIKTQEHLNKQLTRRGVSIDVFDNADRFLAALSTMRVLIDTELNWA